MSGVTFGDIFFIVMVGGGIYLILFLVNRSRSVRLPKEPSTTDIITDDTLLSILSESRTIALVGASSNPARPSHQVLDYLLREGYTVFPVNPREENILGQPVFESLDDLPRSPDIVDVFRSPEHVPDIARQAAAIKAKVLWLQEGVVSSEGLDIARSAGMSVVMDRCVRKEHRRLVSGRSDAGA
jgi:hypothetical protein